MIRALLGQFNSLMMALLFAIIIWAVATSEQNPIRDGYLPDPLPIEVTHLSPGMVVMEKKIETVRVKIRAPQISWDQITTTSFRATADLQSVGAGSHQIPIQVQVNDPRVSIVSVEPPTLGIRLEPLSSRELDLRAEVLDAAPIGYVYRNPVLTPSRVTVSGPAPLVEQITEVSVDLYLRGAKSTVEREVAVVPRDQQGNLVQGVVITPSVILVKVPVEQRVGYKDVSIRAALKGTVASGYWISNITVAPSVVTIAGNPDILAKIPGFIETLPIDVTAATAEVTKRATVSLPEGVSILNNEGITVQVSVTPILGGQTIRRKVIVQGLRRGLAVTVSPDTVEIILSGPVPSLQSIGADDVQVFVDASTLTAGVYQLKPRVPVIPDALKVQSIVPETLQVVITDLPLTPTATFTPTLTTTLPLTQTQILTPTLTPAPAR